MKPEAKAVHEILEKTLFDLQDLPESPYNKSARADLWYALQNQATQRDLEDNMIDKKTLEMIDQHYEADRNAQVARLEALISQVKAHKHLDEAGGLDMDALSDAIGNLEDAVNTPHH